MSMGAAVSAINTKLLVTIIGLLVTLVGLGTKYVYDQHQMTVLMQAQANQQAAEEAASRAQDEAIRAEFKRREDKKRSEGPLKFQIQ